MSAKTKIVPITPEERLGYEIPGPTGRRGTCVAMPVAPSDIIVQRHTWWHTIRTEERFGLIVFTLGLYWISTLEELMPTWEHLQFLLTRRPSGQLLMLGMAIWLHAKWRRATRVV
jgi:hypothetical protein